MEISLKFSESSVKFKDYPSYDCAGTKSVSTHTNLFPLHPLFFFKVKSGKIINYFNHLMNYSLPVLYWRGHLNSPPANSHWDSNNDNSLYDPGKFLKLMSCFQTCLKPGITHKHIEGDCRDNFTPLSEDQRCNRANLLGMKFRIILLGVEEDQQVPRNGQICCFLGTQIHT